MRFLFAILFCSVTLLSVGQAYQYPKTGMVHNARYIGNQLVTGGDHSFAYLGDTVICRNTFSKYCNFVSGSPAICSTGSGYVFLTRMIGSQIYVVNNPCSLPVDESLWYDWGLSVGNYTTLFPGYYYAANVIVDSVYYKTMLNGQQRKYFRMHGLTGMTTNYVYRIIEGIGDIERGFFGEYGYDGGHDVFVCHQENDTLIWETSNINLQPYCNYQTVTKISSLKNDFLSVYPNPTTSIMNIVDENNQLENTTIEIKNTLGQVVFTSPFKSQIDISDLSDGVYLFNIQNANFIHTIKILKQ